MSAGAARLPVLRRPRARAWRRVAAGLGITGLAAVLLAPVLALWMPGTVAQHAYDEFSFALIARRVLPAAGTPEQLIQAATDYSKRHLWLIDNPVPYDGKPFDYLVEGIGWCDYAVKVFGRLLATRGMHVRYAFLKDAQGSSPHTLAEVYVRGKWRVADPFFNLIYKTESGEWPSLEDVTPDFVDRLPQMARLRATTSEAVPNILDVARRTYPLPQPPQRSDDFLRDKNLFDWITDAYARLLGRRFACWYQDQYLRRLAAIPDPQQRLWYQARHYHLYGRLEEAERAYRALWAQRPVARYAERLPLFLSRLLIRQRRFAEALAVLEEDLREHPGNRWTHYHLALCYEGAGDRAKAITHFERYQTLHGTKFALEASAHLHRLRQPI